MHANSPVRSGLEGQLLGVTIQHEQPELEKAKSEMLRQEEGFKASILREAPSLWCWHVQGRHDQGREEHTSKLALK